MHLAWQEQQSRVYPERTVVPLGRGPRAIAPLADDRVIGRAGTA